MFSLRNVVATSLLTTLTISAGAFAAESTRPSLPTRLPAAAKFEEKDLAESARGPAAAPELAVNTTTPNLPQAPVAGQTQNAASAPAAVVTTDAAPQPTPRTFISDGQLFAMDEIGFSIIPPATWEVSTYESSMTMVMREPKDDKPSYDKPKYQRNITVTSIAKASPIDESRAIELEASMTKRASEDSSIQNFKVIEHKFFNYRGENDGLLVYSSMDLGEYKMMQMHVLVSGEEKQFLMTYSDLAERFSDAADTNFAKAWSSIVSTTVKGLTPNRQEKMVRVGSIAAGALLLLLTVFFIRRRQNKSRYANDADAFEDFDSVNNDGEATGSMIATLANGWRIGSKVANASADDLFFSSAVGTKIGGNAPQTKATSFVSGF